MYTHCHGLALFSGGLDSILAVKVIEEQGLSVKCIHFTSPFFGKPWLKESWLEDYGLDVAHCDVGADFARLLRERPRFGFGKFLNPCVDCKILLAARAREKMQEYGAKFLISGEVLGQRPMSQRRDALDIITREAQVRDILVRPLCAKRLKPTWAEEQGLVNRELLHGIGGRGRKEQLRLAEKYQLPHIPTPAGGCMLAEKESARRYWPILQHAPSPSPDDFHLANIGRQYWAGSLWLVVGRDKLDNEKLEKCISPRDLVFKVKGFPGPLCLGRQLSPTGWPSAAVRDASAFAASFSPKARRAKGPVEVMLLTKGLDEPNPETITVTPARDTELGWAEPEWDNAYEAKKAEEMAQKYQSVLT